MTPNDKQKGRVVRRCASCRQRRDVSALVRLVADGDGALRVDLERREPGRGLNLCPSLDCLRDALRKNLFKRSLGVVAAEDCDRVASRISEAAVVALERMLRDGREKDGVRVVPVGEERPAALADLAARLRARSSRVTLQAVAIDHPRIHVRVSALVALLNQFTFDLPGAKTRRPAAIQRAVGAMAVSSRVSGEL